MDLDDDYCESGYAISGVRYTVVAEEIASATAIYLYIAPAALLPIEHAFPPARGLARPGTIKREIRRGVNCSTFSLGMSGDGIVRHSSSR